MGLQQPSLAFRDLAFLAEFMPAHQEKPRSGERPTDVIGAEGRIQHRQKPVGEFIQAEAAVEGRVDRLIPMRHGL